MTGSVTIYEVGPRDGLQNEARLIPAAQKVALIDHLSQTGLTKIEVTSFVSPKWVPQLADAAQVMGAITRQLGITYSALTPNMKGFEAAQAAKADEVAIFASASEGFSQHNINCTVAESLARFAPLAAAARAAKLPLRGYISCVTECPYDGPTLPEQVAALAKDLRAMGCYQISLGDTLGRATPAQTEAMLRTVLLEVPAPLLAGHFHDTGDAALPNIDVGLALGLRCFDSAIGGLGGCPYAPGAAGNVATEKVAAHLAQRGFETGLDPAALAGAAAYAQDLKEDQ